jgi:hypothetical protein
MPSLAETHNGKPINTNHPAIRPSWPVEHGSYPEYRTRIHKHLKKVGSGTKSDICRACKIPSGSLTPVFDHEMFITESQGPIGTRVLVKLNPDYEAPRKPKDQQWAARKPSKPKQLPEVPPVDERVQAVVEVLKKEQPLLLDEIREFTLIPQAELFALLNNNDKVFERDTESMYWLKARK